MKKKNNQKILVSIVTIVYNGEKFLQQTIDSIAEQTYKNIEYIIVDGGSTDGTLKIIEKNKKIITKWISEKDEGVSDAFNKGIEMCNGDIIGILNADDWYEKDAVQLVVENMVDKIEKIQQDSKKNNNKKNAEVVFFGNMNYINENNTCEIYIADNKKLTKEMTLNHPAVFVSKLVYQKYGKFLLNYKYAMDYEILLRFYKKGVDFCRIDKILSNMRASGLSDKNWFLALKESKNAKISNGSNFFISYFYFYYQVFRKKTSQILKKIGLGKIIIVYRRYFSVMKKVNILK